MQKENSSLFTALKSSPLGLTAPEALQRLGIYGKNILIEKKRTPLIVKFLAQFRDLMVIILIVAAGISLIAGERNDAIVIMIVVMLNAVIGFVQEFKTEKALEALKNMLSPRAKVIRNGEKTTINAEDLVPGDVLILQEGDRICADARLTEASQLQCAEAALTGESLPVTKSAENSDIENMEHAYRVYMGTEITHGSGKAIVLSTGMQTEFGKIAGLTTDTKKDISPLQKELFHIGVFVGKITLALSAILVLVSIFWQGRPILESIIFAVAVAVAAVPEGLPATITIALAIGVQKMAKHHAIIKQLSSVETLGSTTVICSDKTGTLTKNEMTVTDVWTNFQLFKVSGVGYAPEGTVTATDPAVKLPAQLLMLGRIAALCNNASIAKHDDGTYHVLGDPTEGALDTAAMKLGITITAEEKSCPRVYELSFDADRKRMSTIHLVNGSTIAYVKGAPDVMLERCTKILIDNREVPLTADHRSVIIDANRTLAQRALRVLGMAYRSVEKKPNYSADEVEKDLVFVGLMGMIDPPRPEVLDAITLTKQAGIRIFIVTGDYGPTAAAIAAQVGLVTPELVRVVTGEELDTMNDDALKALVDKQVKEQILFARVSPKHKMRVVSALKELHEIVAVTGDGVNDAPALKRADIGVAMGITGTDVSKEAANMILTDDSFASIVLAIKEGRRIYTNLKKFVHYIFSSNIGELVTIFAGIMLGLPAPLTAILILCVNLGTDVLPALALGVDPEEAYIMQVPPRDPMARMLNKPFITRIFIIGIFIGLIVVSAYLWSLWQQGWQWGEELTVLDPRHERSATLAFALLVLIQFINAFSSRSEVNSVFTLRLLQNRALIWSITISGMLLVASIHIPWLNNALHTVPLSAQEWIVVIAGSMLILFVDEVRKLIVTKKHRRTINV